MHQGTIHERISRAVPGVPTSPWQEAAVVRVNLGNPGFSGGRFGRGCRGAAVSSLRGSRRVIVPTSGLCYKGAGFSPGSSASRFVLARGGRTVSIHVQCVCGRSLSHHELEMSEPGNASVKDVRRGVVISTTTFGNERANEPKRLVVGSAGERR